MNDRYVLATWLSDTVLPQMLARWPDASRGPATPLLTTVVQESVAGLRALPPVVRAAAQRRLVALGLALLKEHVPKIITAYRMTGKPAPTQPSAYMQQLTSALDDAFPAAANAGCFEKNGRALDGDAALAQAVCAAWAESVHAHVSELLQALVKSEVAMKKLAAGRAPAAAAATAAAGEVAGLSDAAKARRQVALIVVLSYFDYELRLLHVYMSSLVLLLFFLLEVCRFTWTERVLLP